MSDQKKQSSYENKVINHKQPDSALNISNDNSQLQNQTNSDTVKSSVNIYNKLIVNSKDEKSSK